MNANPFVLLTSPEMHQMGREISAHIKAKYEVEIPHYEVTFTTFANGEILAEIPFTIRHQHVFFLHAMQFPDPNTAMMSLLITNDAINRASASGITSVLPFISYGRQDRKNKPRVPISSRLMADIMQTNRCLKNIITIDMHAEQLQGFFDIPVDNLTGVNIFDKYVAEKFGPDFSDVVFLSADIGGSTRNNRLAKAVGDLRKDQPEKDLPVSIGRKHRPGANLAEILDIIGDGLEGKRVIIFEDIVDTGTTACGIIQMAMEMKPKEIHLLGTHGIFSRKAAQLFAEKNISVISTDTIPRSKEYYEANPWLKVVTCAPYFADAIYQNTLVGGSVSGLNRTC